MIDDVHDWAGTCIALHNDKAEEYAMAQVHKMRETGESEGADFWLQVAVAIDLSHPKTKAALH